MNVEPELSHARSFADRLNDLFRMTRPAGQAREYSNGEVAAATGLSSSYIGYLRKGLRGNPSIETVQAFARFFGVRPSYFFDETDEHPEVDARVADALQTPGVSQIALRAADARLSPAGIEAITSMIEQVRRLEQARDEKGPPPARPSR